VKKERGKSGLRNRTSFPLNRDFDPRAKACFRPRPVVFAGSAALSFAYFAFWIALAPIALK
jgi:hypothetical protein